MTLRMDYDGTEPMAGNLLRVLGLAVPKRKVVMRVFIIRHPHQTRNLMVYNVMRTNIPSKGIALTVPIKDAITYEDAVYRNSTYFQNVATGFEQRFGETAIPIDQEFIDWTEERILQWFRDCPYFHLNEWHKVEII